MVVAVEEIRQKNQGQKNGEESFFAGGQGLELALGISEVVPYARVAEFKQA